MLVGPATGSGTGPRTIKELVPHFLTTIEKLRWRSKEDKNFLCMGQPMSFRLQAKNVFLTYSQAATIETKESLLDFLKTRGNGITYCLVSRELHEDGNAHYHALISYAKRRDFRNPRYFDFNGIHPNMQSAASERATMEYIKKDGDIIETGNPPAGKQQEPYHDICLRSNYMEWLEYCINAKIGFGYCKAIWSAVHPSVTNTITNAERPGELCTALQQFQYDDWERCLVLIGPTGCGKTVWALKNAPKPALFIRHIDRLKDFDPEIHKSIIFDDMIFTHYPAQAQIHMVDNYLPSDIHIRYSVATIPAGTPKIFTCNERPFNEHPAINRRIKVYKVVV